MVNIDQILTEYLNHKFTTRDSDFWNREIKRIADLLLFELVEGGAITGRRASAGLEDPTLPKSTLNHHKREALNEAETRQNN